MIFYFSSLRNVNDWYRQAWRVRSLSRAGASSPGGSFVQNGWHPGGDSAESAAVSCDGKSKWCQCDSFEIFLFLFWQSGLCFPVALSDCVMPVRGRQHGKSFYKNQVPVLTALFEFVQQVFRRLLDGPKKIKMKCQFLGCLPLANLNA